MKAFGGDFGRFDYYTKKDDVHTMMSIGKGTSNTTDVGGAENDEGTESDVDPIRELGLGDDDDKDLRFTAYSLPAHMHNVDLSVEDELEFVEQPHRRLGQASSSLDLDVDNRPASPDLGCSGGHRGLLICDFPLQSFSLSMYGLEKNLNQGIYFGYQVNSGATIASQ
ncbi:hypothetical protein PVK06_024747 [Gossypium arboreum]|uniref:Uncharacterized protein n=1 Tax=Gossypium arboreum TaxID=29729 RepID=A0ABR0PEJ3_GOSAR|nr:hypothetical protein PVK06_024747 [Gossypium arboreum]